MKQHAYPSYSDYRSAQVAANRRKLRSVWALEENIRFLAELIAPAEFGICHGTRNGAEQRWFAESLECYVMGTEISDTANQYPATLEWDFHEPRSEWIGAADFVYSNALDHAFNPERALSTWAEQLKYGGYLLIEHSADCDGEEAVTRYDPFGASVDEIMALMRPHVSRSFAIDMPARKPRVKELSCVIGIR